MEEETKQRENQDENADGDANQASDGEEGAEALDEERAREKRLKKEKFYNEVD